MQKKETPRTQGRALPYYNGDREALVSDLLAAARAKRSLTVFTPGAVIAAAAERDGALDALLRRADVLVADGYGCRLAARLSGSTPPPRIAGIDLAEALLAGGEAFGARVFLYGGKFGVAHRAAILLGAKYPRLRFATADGFGADPLDEICAFSPHFVFVCLGFPRQEKWIAQNAAALGAVCLGLGGSLDVWSGDLPRAPRAVQKAGLEWAYRTLREPHRITRLLPLPRYFASCLWDRRHK
ncbi:MAG: WecB/TagA/CpsF family glycosyltransferase [Clostridia bacterium]|nr:WecB/TagA/CpsF family glycosyltransferase [Clostridia bacterium]